MFYKQDPNYPEYSYDGGVIVTEVSPPPFTNDYPYGYVISGSVYLQPVAAVLPDVLVYYRNNGSLWD